MNQTGESTEAPASARRRTSGPDLEDSNRSWDDPSSLRSEFLTEEQLAEHAVLLARRHGPATRRGSARPLRKRFREIRRLVRGAYAELARGAERKREPSPAELWLLDNAHVVEGQLREIDEDLPWGYLVELPRMGSGSMRGYPLVYGLCLDYLRHTDCHVDFASLSRFVNAYQSVRTLTIGELWAVPIMLRLGLVLSVGALASSEANPSDRDDAETWGARLLAAAHESTADLGRCLIQLDEAVAKKAPSPAFLVTLLRRLREHDDAPIEALDWIAARTARLQTTPEELARRHHLRQAADQVSVGNAITSMRSINSLDWTVFFTETSHVEAVLARDPSGAYPNMDDGSRDRCRHEIERLARRSLVDEVEIAKTALALAGEPHAREHRSHVGFYLVDEGRRELEKRIGYRPGMAERARRSLERFPSFYYLGTITAITALLTVLGARAFFETSEDGFIRALVTLSLVFASSEIAVAIVNALAVTLVPPRILPKLEFDDGIPEEHRTLVVVPTLLDSEQGLDSLFEELVVRSLANSDEHLHFALLTDFPDADVPERPGERELLERAVRTVERLNEGHAEPRFFFLHRRRVPNPVEKNFMGWERKRGKLAELNRLLRGATDTTFDVIAAPTELLLRIRYVITLDTDTDLPLGVARRLVGAMAHPLNRPQVDPKTQRVTRGHAIIQPRVGTAPMSARLSIFARLAAGPPGIDPYTTAVSDVYQDLFGEGSFVGKGIYDVDAFTAALDGRVPENQLLSHDLFESIFARAALASDIEVLDEQPAAYSVAAGRLHRWMRGDWQLLPWLLPRPPGENGRRHFDLRPFDTWRIVDNLRRSLLAPHLLVLVACSWLHGFSSALVGTGFLLAVFVVPVLGRVLFGFVRADSQLEWLGGLGGDLRSNLRQAVLSLVFLPDQALVALDAIVRALHRQLVSRRKMLEWTSMRDAALADSGSVFRVPRLLVAGLASFGLGIAIFATDASSGYVAAPFVAAWAFSPWIALWVSRIRPIGVSEPWGEHETRLFRRVARKTWRFFERFVGELDHHLPPDNFQEDPRGVVAHRTSPTNIGLYLLSVVAARDLGFITLGQVTRRLEATLRTIERLEKREGHVLNWYDTLTLKPLEPRYVSTVDSGNLAGYLWTLSEACRDLERTPVDPIRTLEGMEVAVELGLESARRVGGETLASVEKFRQAIEGALVRCRERPTRALSIFRRLIDEHRGLFSSEDRSASDSETNHWISTAEQSLEAAQEEYARLYPHLHLLEELEMLRGREASAAFRDEFERLLSTVRELDHPRALVERGDDAVERTHALALLVVTSVPSDESSHDRLTFLLTELGSEIEQARREAVATIASLEEIRARSEELVERMNFAFLYDEKRSLFSIGYNVSGTRLDNSHYDLLASEARLASIVAIAKGDVPEKHWFRLGRLRAEYASTPGLLSWSGSMFEYLMPLLVLRSYPDTLLDQTYHAVIDRQIEYAKGFGAPWGISEAAYNVMDLGMNYQYRAFGVPDLGLKPGLGEDLVVSPYATALAALVRARAAARNFEHLREFGLEGPFGFYESVDLTPSRLPPGRTRVLVKAFMAHHQGMTLVALSNLLTDFSMQRRFHTDPRIKACDLLLEERIPVRAGVAEPEIQRVPSSLANLGGGEAVEHFSLAETRGPELRAHLLGQGSVSTLVTTSGDGFTSWRGLDVNRFREEASLGAGGIYLYLRNRRSGALWSGGYLPTRTEPDAYDVIFSLDKIELSRRDGDVETLTEIVVSPEHPADVRRITITNHGADTIELDVTSFTELSLASRAADVSHPAFQKMFVETEAVPGRHALIAHRKKRSTHDPDVWVGQILTIVQGEGTESAFETSRSRFVGRGRDLESPRGLDDDAVWEGATTSTLDPAFVLRQGLRIEPGAQGKLSLVTVMADSRDAVLDLVETFASPHGLPRVFELAWADARVEVKHLRISAVQAHRYQRLLSSVLFPKPVLRGPVNPPLGTRGKNALWSQGISGDLPIVVLRLDDTEFSELCRDLLLAHEFWRLNGVQTDLVLLNEEAESYLQPVQDAIFGLIRSTSAEGHVDQRGGVFVRRTAHVGEEDLQLLLAAARVVLRASAGSLARQLRALSPAGATGPKRRKTAPSRVGVETQGGLLGSRIAAPKFVRITERDESNDTGAIERPARLVFDNGIGAFTPDGREYVLTIGPGRRPPLPWSNVIANARFGALVTESGGGYTWAENSQKFRLTPWSNDPTLDPSGELFYVRDRGDDRIWSLTPAPAGGNATYLVRHGQGYTVFEHERRELVQRLTVSVSPDESVKVWHVTIENRGTSPRRLGVCGFAEWVLGNHRESLRVSTVTTFHPEVAAILARNPFSPFARSHAFFSASRAVSGFTAERSDFFGRAGSRARPEGLLGGALSAKTGAGLDPCAALELDVTLAPGEKTSFSFVLGLGQDEHDALALAARYHDDGETARVAERSAETWERILTQITVDTPDPAFNLLTNRWLLYQALGCRFWGRSAFYQSSGAYGFRDQLQDSMAFLHARPDLARAHLLLAASRQFLEGDVQHWWHADNGEGVRTHCSDDLLWLPWAAVEYAESTGDTSIWNERVPFLQERLLAPGEDDLYAVPPVSAESATLYEHCVRALDAGNTKGPRGLPLMRAGDWNDGMNRVGLRGGGESVWLAWFLAHTLDRFAAIAEARGDHERAGHCRRESGRIGRAIDETAWDGAWYRRAYFDDGTALGSTDGEECRIDAIAQSWAVISRAGDPNRAQRALDASLRHLLDRDEKMLLLLAPPFQNRGPDPGYIAAYPPGIRENGGQYTHGILWSALALLLEGRGDEGHELLAMLNPIAHASTPSEVARYQVEPYVLAADVYSVAPYVGRGGWTWYTGSASWMYRIGVERLLGIRRRGARLLVDPCIPAAWPKFEVTYRTPGGGMLRITVENPDAVTRGVRRLELDGVPSDDATILLPEDDAVHSLAVTLGTLSDSEIRSRARSTQPLEAAPPAFHPPRQNPVRTTADREK